MRNYSFFDQVCLGIDQAIRAIAGKTKTSGRANPAADIGNPQLTIEQSHYAARLMRVNHSGEVCAQALYHAQGLTSRQANIKAKMQHAAIEEGDHLAWCSARLTELGSHTSYLNPLWYAGSFMIGLTAGLIGDKWNLGFLSETEHQVVRHLESHLKKLPADDLKSQKILQQMSFDEAQHRDEAIQAGAVPLPKGIKKLMQFSSTIMVNVAFWI